MLLIHSLKRYTSKKVHHSVLTRWFFFVCAKITDECISNYNLSIFPEFDELYYKGSGTVHVLFLAVSKISVNFADAYICWREFVCTYRSSKTSVYAKLFSIRCKLWYQCKLQLQYDQISIKSWPRFWKVCKKVFFFSTLKKLLFLVVIKCSIGCSAIVYIWYAKYLETVIYEIWLIRRVILLLYRCVLWHNKL